MLPVKNTHIYICIYDTYTQQTSTLNDTTVLIDVYIFYKNTLASMYTCSWSFPKPSYVPFHGAFPLPTPSSFEGLTLRKTYLVFYVFVSLRGRSFAPQNKRSKGKRINQQERKKTETKKENVLKQQEEDNMIDTKRKWKEVREEQRKKGAATERKRNGKQKQRKQVKARKEEEHNS